jgi:hypothetical protein
MHWSQNKGRITVKSGTGFALEQGACGILTTRGNLRPLAGKAEQNGARVEFHTRRLSDGAVEFWQSLRNLRAAPLDITTITMFDGVLDLAGAGWRVMHSELFMVEDFFDDYGSMTRGLLEPVPGTEAELGSSEHFPFPGIIFTHPERGTVLMGVLSQERCKPHWSLRRQGRKTLLTAEDRFSGVPRIRLTEGQEFTTERWVMLCTPGGLEDAVDAYYRLLRKRLDFVGADSILREAILWGSWNYNLRPRGHWDVDHDWVVANTRALARMVPGKPRFTMIDDGYQRGCAAIKDDWFASCLEIFYRDGQLPHDPRLFPRGMKGVADAIRKAGGEPAIWTTPRIHRQSSLALERPDLLLKVAGGRPFSKRTAYLDYSLPEVREYTRGAWNTICNEWGYKGVKLDFWSLPFEIPQVRYQNHDRTAVELRNLFLKDLREFIQPGGYVVTGVVMNNGNPFTGRYVDSARIGSDIGAGSWNDLTMSASCLTTRVPFCRHDALLADSDSIGWCPRNTVDENRLWATIALMAGGMCEIGGDLTQLSAEARALLTTATRFFKPARRTLNGITGGGLDLLPSSHMLLERDDGVYEAHLNWSPINRIVHFDRPVRDLWTGKRMSGRCKLPPHGAMLFKGA